VNSYEVKAGIGVFAGTLYDPCLSALSVRYYKKSAILIQHSRIKDVKTSN